MKTRRFGKWFTPGALAAIGASLVLAAPAAANVGAHTFVYQDGERCVDASSQAQDGATGWGLAYGSVGNWIGGSSNGRPICISSSVPPGYMALGQWWYFWNGSQWVVSAWVPYEYNPYTGDYFAYYMSLPSPSAYGNGYYGNMVGAWAWSHVNENGGAWFGGSLWSGYQWYKR